MHLFSMWLHVSESSMATFILFLLLPGFTTSYICFPVQLGNVQMMSAVICIQAAMARCHDYWFFFSWRIQNSSLTTDAIAIESNKGSQLENKPTRAQVHFDIVNNGSKYYKRWEWCKRRAVALKPAAPQQHSVVLPMCWQQGEGCFVGRSRWITSIYRCQQTQCG